MRGTNKDIGESGTDGLEKPDISAPDTKQSCEKPFPIVDYEYFLQPLTKVRKNQNENL